MDALTKLNQFTRREHKEEEVYLFDVILCDNDIDRDLERFSDAALAQLQKLFIGKTGIFDHNPKSAGQTARIFDTEIVHDADRKTRDGRPYAALKAHAYMVRTDSNADLIREIEGGIKKEVSVSCSAGKQLCSVCGVNRRETACSHVPGRTYGEKQCHVVLDEISDAYEWSFVAVPAQVSAGVTKQFSGREDDRMEQKTMEQEMLLQEAEAMLREEVMQLCGRQESAAVCKAMRTAAEKMDLRELMQFRKELQAERTAKAQVQLCGGFTEETESFRFE